jgi:hypothetical protein
MNPQREKELDIVMEWVTEQISSKGQVPRVSDVVHYTYTTLGFRQLKPAAIARRLRLHQAYIMTSPQSRGLKRSKRYRPIVTNTLGMLHGDIGYFPITRDYETPVTFRAGFLVLCDVLSRYVYVAIVRKNKSAEAMIKAFQDIFDQHKKAFGPNGHKIVSISFDQETSVMSKKVQDFLRENHIKFHAFKFSSSKSKMAENAIKRIRNVMAKFIQQNPVENKWWHLLPGVVNSLNHGYINIRGKMLNWRPRDVTVSTLDEFLRDLYKANPVQNFSQYEISPQTVSFKYSVNTVVRPKLIVTSSAAIGEKRSAISVEQDSFIIIEQIAYVNARFEIGRAYRCINKRTREEEIFDEDDLAESI